MATQVINSNVHSLSDQENAIRDYEAKQRQSYKDWGKYLPDELWNFMQSVDPENPSTSRLYRAITGHDSLLGALIPENTIFGKLLNGDASDFAKFWDVLSGGKLAYERALEERDYANNWNSEAAQVARMLAAGLNPYMNGVGSSSASPASVPSPAGPGPVTDFMNTLGSALFQGISGLLNGEIPERFTRLRAMKEDILSKRLDNAEKEKNLGLNADKIRAEIRRLYQDLDINGSEESRNQDRFEEEKRTWLRSQQEHSKRMIEYDDKHNIIAHDISQWSTRDAIEQAQLIALQNSNTQQEYQINVLNELEKAKLIAETNSIINDQNFKWTNFRYQQEQDEARGILENRRDEREHSLYANRNRIEHLQMQLLNNQISTAKYEAELRKYGLTPRSPRFMKQQAGLAQEVPDYGVDFLYNVLDSAPSVIGGVFK